MSNPLKMTVKNQTVVHAKLAATVPYLRLHPVLIVLLVSTAAVLVPVQAVRALHVMLVATVQPWLPPLSPLVRYVRAACIVPPAQALARHVQQVDMHQTQPITTFVWSTGEGVAYKDGSS